jgi:hypothetical protein
MDWIKELEAGVKASLWATFTAASPQDLLEIEKSIRRPLPEDFRVFYQRIGYGQWPNPYGGGVYSPKDIIATIGAPIYFALGSLMPGEEWATAAQHRELWLTQGKVNPDPHRFTERALGFHGMSLLDLLQIGTDGSAGYQMLNLSNSSRIRYLVAYESTEIDLASDSFREGVRAITDQFIR